MPWDFNSAPTQHFWRQTCDDDRRAFACVQFAGASVVQYHQRTEDIVRYLGSRYDPIDRLLAPDTPSWHAYALDLAAPWINGATTLFSMPDTLITPVDTMAEFAWLIIVCSKLILPASYFTQQLHTVWLGVIFAGRITGFVDRASPT